MPALLLGALFALGFPSMAMARAEAATPPEQRLAPDFGAAAAKLEQSGELEALARAAVLRRGLEHFTEAAVDVERFLFGLSCAQVLTERAANIFVEEILDEDTWREAAQWEAVLRRFMAALPPGVAPSVRLRAHVKLAAALWKRSCPIEGHDGACIERIDMDEECRARSAAMPKLPKNLYLVCRKPIPCGCYGAPAFRYVVHERHAGLSQESQRLVKEALRLAASLRPEAATPGDATDDAIAQAYFLQAEPQFEQALTRALVRRQPESGRHPIACQAAKPPSCDTPSSTQIGRWLGNRFEFTKGPGHRLRQQHAYELVLAHPASRWCAAAQARIGQLFVDAEDQLKATALPLSIPQPPPGLSAEEWERGWKGAQDGCVSIEFDELPWSSTANEFIDACNARSALYPSDEPYTRFCRDAQRRHWRYDFGRADEVFRQPRLSDAPSLSLAPVVSVAASSTH